MAFVVHLVVVVGVDGDVGVVLVKRLDARPRGNEATNLVEPGWVSWMRLTAALAE